MRKLFFAVLLAATTLLATAMTVGADGWCC